MTIDETLKALTYIIHTEKAIDQQRDGLLATKNLLAEKTSLNVGFLRALLTYISRRGSLAKFPQSVKSNEHALKVINEQARGDGEYLTEQQLDELLKLINIVFGGH